MEKVTAILTPSKTPGRRRCFPYRRVLRDRVATSGQVLIPFAFVLPALFLFVFLIFETAKLSREKIRHQFAVDSAAFIEMTNYSDFLNRSAYVNGAFPMRIFKEGFGPGKDPKTGQATPGTMIERKNNSSPKSLYDILFENSDFPRTDQQEPLDPAPVWQIEYGGPWAGDLNKNAPDLTSQCEGVTQVQGQQVGAANSNGCRDIITKQNAIDFWLSWDDAQSIYDLYYKIYSLLGSVEDAQFSVFCRLTGASGCTAMSGLGHNFFRKSYWLNTGDSINDAQEGSSYFDLHQFRPKPYCLQQIMIYGNKPTSNAFQPYQVFAPKDPIPMPSTISNCSPPGLFQLEAIPDSDLRSLSTPNTLGGNCARGAAYPGYPIVQHWTAPANYFNVNFNSLMEDGRPCVHSTVSLQGGSNRGGGRVWPDPTPKFQTKLYP